MAPSFNKFRGWPLTVLCFALALLLSASLSPASAGFHPKRYNQRSDYGLLRDHRSPLRLSPKVIKDIHRMACSHLKYTQYKQCMTHNPKNGEMIPLTPKNDPYNSKNALDAVHKNEIYKKSIEEMNFVPKGILKNFTSRVLSEYFSQSSFLNSNSSLSTTLNNNKSNDGELIELNPLNDPYLKNVIDFANKDEKCKKRMEELNLVPNSKNSYEPEVASKMAAFYYSLKDTAEGKQFYIRFNEMTRNVFHNAHDYPYWNFYIVLLSLKITSRLDFSKEVRVKYIEGGRRLEMKLDNIVLFRGSRTDYLKKNENATFQFKQFTSFSSDLTIATGYAPEGLPNETSPTIFMIQGNNVPARSIQEYSMYPQESEYLIDPISKFQIVHVLKNVCSLENFKTNLTAVYVVKYVGNI